MWLLLSHGRDKWFFAGRVFCLFVDIAQFQWMIDCLGAKKLLELSANNGISLQQIDLC